MVNSLLGSVGVEWVWTPFYAHLNGVVNFVCRAGDQRWAAQQDKRWKEKTLSWVRERKKWFMRYRSFVTLVTWWTEEVVYGEQLQWGQLQHGESGGRLEACCVIEQFPWRREPPSMKPALGQCFFMARRPGQWHRRWRTASSPVTSVFLKKNVFCFFFFKHVFFLKNTVEKKQGSKCFFFSKPPVFKINIHNLSQFVNHTVTLVQNKNNNERISLKWGLCS